MLSSVAPGTFDQYKKTLREWALFCITRKLNPYSAQEDAIIDFLNNSLSAGASYGTINSSRSAIALVLSYELSESSLLSRFMRAVYRKRPPKAKYDKIWDVDPVLDKLAPWPDAENLDLAQLTSKLCVLMALGTAQRMQTLSLIKLSNIKESKSGFEIQISDLIKSSRPGSSQPLLIFRFLSQDKNLCIASHLRLYLDKTRSLRKPGLDELFITTKKPHKAASSATISRWIRATLKSCGVDDGYTAYSTKHASSSAALKKGISLDIIKNAAGWSTRSRTFFRFYNRPIELKETYSEVLFRR